MLNLFLLVKGWRTSRVIYSICWTGWGFSAGFTAGFEVSVCWVGWFDWPGCVDWDLWAVVAGWTGLAGLLDWVGWVGWTGWDGSVCWGCTGCGLGWTGSFWAGFLEVFLGST